MILHGIVILEGFSCDEVQKLEKDYQGSFQHVDNNETIYFQGRSRIKDANIYGQYICGTCIYHKESGES